MSTLPPEIEAEGMRAYEQARAFESLQRKRLPWAYAGIDGLLAVAGIVLLALGHATVGVVALMAAAFSATLAWKQWRGLRVRHAENLRRLAALEAQYGEEAPWLQVERHLAALAELRSELAAEEGRSGA